MRAVPASESGRPGLAVPRAWIRLRARAAGSAASEARGTRNGCAAPGPAAHTGEQLGHAHSARPRPHCPSLPRGSRAAGSAPLPTPPCWGQNGGVSSRLRFKPHAPENSLPSTGAGGGQERGAGAQVSAPPSRQPAPWRLEPLLVKCFLPGRFSVGRRGATSLSPGLGELGSAPPAPAAALGRDRRLTGPLLGASPVAAARLQSHRQVPAQPLRQPAERSR